jgi:hypothetical protein
VLDSIEDLCLAATQPLACATTVILSSLTLQRLKTDHVRQGQPRAVLGGCHLLQHRAWSPHSLYSVFDSTSLSAHPLVAAQIQTITLIALGAVLIQNEHYHQLLGSDIKHVGGGLVLTGLLYLFVAVLSYAIARSQNKFLMLLQVALLVGLVFLQVLLGGVALGRAVSSFDVDVKVACLTVGGYAKLTAEQQHECDEFVRSDEFVGATLVWQDYYTLSKSDGDTRALVLNLQKSNFCCGLGAPTRCRSDDRSFPSSFPSTALSTAHKQRVICSGTLYPGTSECGGVKGQCSYDLPGGVCGTNPITPSTRGCAAFVYKTLSTPVQAIGGTVLLLALFPVRPVW